MDLQFQNLTHLSDMLKHLQKIYERPKFAEFGQILAILKKLKTNFVNAIPTILPIFLSEILINTLVEK